MSEKQVSKKMKNDEDDIRYFIDFLAESKNKEMTSMLRNIFSEMEIGGSLMSTQFLRVKSTNANLKSSFTFATLEVEAVRTDRGNLVVAPLALFFMNGCKVLRRFLDKNSPAVPNDVPKRRALRDLVGFLTRDHSVVADNRDNIGSEFMRALRYAQYLLLPLVEPKTIVIDKKYREKVKFSECCAVEQTNICQEGDTSFGCAQGWYGQADIMITDMKIPVTVVEHSDDASVHSDMSEEMIRDDEFSQREITQVMAQTIVSSFLQHKRNPSVEQQFLVPGIALSAEKLLVYLYDCVNDIFLEGAPIELYKNTGTGVMNARVVLVLWLVLNYKIFGTGIPERYKQFKADFQRGLTSEKLNMYMNDVEQPLHIRPGEEDAHQVSTHGACLESIHAYYDDTDDSILLNMD